MIGKFFPFPVYAASASVTYAPTRVRSTSSATELVNIFRWILWNQSDGQ